MNKILRNYQKEGVEHILKNPNSMLWLQMGLGKTIITLTSIIERMKKREVKKTLIFGPLRVIESVWENEATEWSHTRHLRFSLIRGSEKQRIKSLQKDADIYLINYELMNWLSEYLTKFKTEFPFELVVYDEVSKLKQSTSVRMKGAIRDIKGKKVRKIGWVNLIPFFKYKIGLTGTPATNGYTDLHGQYLAVDGGERLGRTVTQFRNTYCLQGFDGWSYIVPPHCKAAIEERIKDITLKMDTKDYLDMPPLTQSNLVIDLPKKLREKYRTLEKEMFLELESGKDLTLFNQISVSNKCMQLCNGNIYSNSELMEWESIHDLKLKALEDILEEAAGSPVLCAYSFKIDALRIMKHFKHLNPVNLTELPAKKTSEVIKEWKLGKIKLLIGHPASMGHGIDGLQEKGSIVVWYGLNWSLELYEQMNARILRSGQTKPVSVIRIICKNTIEEVVSKVLELKVKDQEQLKSIFNDYKRRPLPGRAREGA